MLNYQFDGNPPSANVFVRDCFCAAYGISDCESGSVKSPDFDFISFSIPCCFPTLAENPFCVIIGAATATSRWKHNTLAISDAEGVIAGDQDLLSGSVRGASIAQTADLQQPEAHVKLETDWQDSVLSPSLELDAAPAGVNVVTTNRDPAFRIASPADACASSSDDEPTGIEGIQIQGTEFEVTEGTSFNRVIANFSTESGTQPPAKFCARIDWGDSSISQGTIMRDGLQFHIAGKHTYGRFGSYPVKVQIQADGRLIAETASIATVHDASLQAFGHFARAAAGREFAGVVAHFRDRNRFSQMGDFSARIHWADGTNSEGIIEANLDGGYDVLGKHVYQSAGNFPVAVTIVSTGGNLATAHGSIRVDAINIISRGLTAVAIVGSDSKLIVAEFDDSDRRATASIYTAEIDWSDGTTSSALVDPRTSGRFGVAGTHRYTCPGMFSVRVTISDSSNHSAATTGTVHAIS